MCEHLFLQDQWLKISHSQCYKHEEKLRCPNTRTIDEAKKKTMLSEGKKEKENALDVTFIYTSRIEKSCIWCIVQKMILFLYVMYEKNCIRAFSEIIFQCPYLYSEANLFCEYKRTQKVYERNKPNISSLFYNKKGRVGLKTRMQLFLQNNLHLGDKIHFCTIFLNKKTHLFFYTRFIEKSYIHTTFAHSFILFYIAAKPPEKGTQNDTPSVSN